jgi:transposase
VIGRNVAIYVSATPLDARRCFDGLAAAVRETLNQDPESGALFVFANKRGDRVKILWWDRAGHCLLQKRRMRFTKPCSDAVVSEASWSSWREHQQQSGRSACAHGARAG